MMSEPSQQKRMPTIAPTTTGSIRLPLELSQIPGLGVGEASYTDGLVAAASHAESHSAEAWARAMFEQLPGAVRTSLVGIWTVLGPPSATRAKC